MIKKVLFDVLDMDGMALGSAMVQGISCAYTDENGKRLYSFNTGSGQTHYFKTEQRFLDALNAELSERR